MDLDDTASLIIGKKIKDRFFEYELLDYDNRHKMFIVERTNHNRNDSKKLIILSWDDVIRFKFYEDENN